MITSEDLAARGVAELLPCPFCGGSAESDFRQPYRNIRTGKLGDAVAIYCTRCDANMSLCREDHPGADPDDLLAELVAAWNRRATPAALAASPEVQAMIRAAAQGEAA